MPAGPIDYRPVTWQWFHDLQASKRAAISSGTAWNYGVEPRLSFLQEYTIEFTTAPDCEIGLFGVAIAAQGSHSVLMRWYEGGSVTPGAPITAQALNRSKSRPAPLTSISADATIDTPGSLFWQTYASSDEQGGDPGGLVLAAGTPYHVTFINDVDINETQDPDDPYPSGYSGFQPSDHRLHIALVFGRLS